MSKNVLFVCAGNVFRSMSAMFAAKKMLEQLSVEEIFVDSAGIRARPEKKPIQFVIDVLANKGIDATSHLPKKLTPEMLATADVVITFDKGLQANIEAQFGFSKSVLFNEFCFNNLRREILDIQTEDIFVNPISDSKTMKPEAVRFISETIDHIVESAPNLLDRLEKSLNISLSPRQVVSDRELGERGQALGLPV